MRPTTEIKIESEIHNPRIEGIDETVLRSALLGKARDEKRNVYEFWVLAGLCTGEIISVEWRDVDYEQARLHVRRSVVLMEKDMTQLGHTTLQMLDRHYGKWMAGANRKARSGFADVAPQFSI